MLSCSPIGTAAGLPSSSEDGGLLPFISWASKLRLTKKALRHKQIFPRLLPNSQSLNSSPNHDLFFQRFLGMRNSFKSHKLPPPPSPVEAVSSTAPTIKEELQRTLEGCSSKDSGLGEEEVISGILRSETAPTKKHVMIREPSLSNLPSTRRRSRQSCRVVTTRVYSGLPTEHNNTKQTVQGQWDSLYSKASDDLQAALPDLEPYPLKALFSKEEPPVEVEDISSVLRTIYRILYHDWGTNTGTLGLSLHCIQVFLVSIVRNLDLLEEDDLKEKSSMRFSDLLRDCELLGYSNVDACLRKSQTVFIEFWCSLLNIPVLKDSFSSQERKNILRLSLRRSETSPLCGEGEQERRLASEKALKHRSSIF